MIIVNPPYKNPSPTSAVEPPIWCAYLAAYYGGEILDADALGLTVDETLDRIKGESALIVAMGANPSASSTPKMGVVNKIITRHMLAMPTGLHPMALGYGRPFPPVEELIKLKPAWNKVDFSLYRAHNWHCLHDLDSRDGYGVIYTRFGCPYNCSYCNIHTLYKGITFRDPLDVITEIDYLVSRGVKNLKIADELFTVNQGHVITICDLIIERGYKLNIWAYARVNTVSPELLARMKLAGINWICYGYESGSIDVLKGVGKKQYGWKATKMTKDAGINILGNFMFGLPDDSLETMTDTLDMAKEFQCEYVNFYCTMAYPGSKLYMETPVGDLPKRWEDYDQFSPTAKPLPTKHLSSRQVLEYRDYAFNAYYSDENYQDMIQKKFGDKALNHIKEMLKWKVRETSSSAGSSS